MPEIVTESFCERCGTRYAFDPPPPARKRRQIGLPMVGSRKNAAGNGAAVALDPFLAVFRFCLECRQYTCPSCWNDAAGFCASCVPFPDAPPVQEIETAEVEPERLVVEASAWPRSDLTHGQSETGGEGDDSDVAELREARAEAERVEAECLEAERLEAERLEAERLEAERRRLEAERLEAERLEAERLETERVRLEVERVEAERVEQARRDAETARLEAERREAARLEAEVARLATEITRLEAERIDAVRLDAERAELARVEAEAARLGVERLEARRLEVERQEADRQEAERQEAERQRLEAERQRQEAERLEAEREAIKRLEAERLEAERQRLEAERLELEQQRKEVERLDAERQRAETERLEAERQRAEAERQEAIRQRLEAERLEAESREAERHRQEAERLRSPDDPGMGFDVAWGQLLSSQEDGHVPDELEDWLGLREPAKKPEPTAAEGLSTEAAPAAPWMIMAPDPVAQPLDTFDEARAWPPRGAVFRPRTPPNALEVPGSGIPLPPIRDAARTQATSGVPSMVSRIFSPSGGGTQRPSSGIRPCASCALPLSAAAQFCRRCGKRQG